VESNYVVKWLAPHIRLRYGGYNTLFNLLEKKPIKVSQPTTGYITWTAWWLRFGWLRNKRMVVFVHGKEISQRKGIPWDQMRNHAMTQAYRLIAVSEYTAKWLIISMPLLEKDRIKVVHHGLDYPELKSLERYEHKIDNKVVTVLSIGQDIPRKGFRALEASIKRLSEIISVRLEILVTEGLNDRADEHVKVSIGQSEKAKVIAFANADIFVLANRHIGPDFEGFGYVVLEAMLAGLPCIVGRFGGTSEIIRHGVDGFVVDSENTSELDMCIRFLAEDPELRYRMGQSARERVLTMFSASKFYDRLQLALD
jgi:phosphatidyl-myo-inositol dimannoside synthase